MLLPKNPRQRDKRYTDSAQHEACWACGIRDETIIAAHVRAGEHRGMSEKPHDFLTVPLCHTHHMEQEAHPGPEWWLENVFKRILKRRYEAWRDGKRLEL